MKVYASKGVSIVESIFYIAILVILLTVVVNIFFMMSQSYNQIKFSADLQNSATLALDKITREIRNASNVDLVNSVFNSNNGVLTLNTTDIVDGSSKTLQFYINSGVLSLKENGIYFDQLTSSSTVVTKLMFKKLDNGKSLAIKTEMTIKASSTIFNRSANFYSTTIVGNSY